MHVKQKREIVASLINSLKEYPSFYLVKMEGLKALQDNKFRRKLFENELKVRVVKNTLLIKALEQVSQENGADYSQVYEVLKGNTAIIFIDEERYNLPAKIIKSFREDEGLELPELKAAYIDGDIYVGDGQLKALTKLKSRDELLMEVMHLVRSPFDAVLGAIKQGQAKIFGLLEAIEQKQQ